MFFFDGNEIVKRLKKYPVLEHFSTFALAELVARSKIIKLDTNQMLFCCNDPSDSVYYLMDGHLECFSSDSLSIKVASIRSGEMVGEMGVVADEPRSMAAKATRESQLLKIDKSVFMEFFEENPQLLMILTQTMAKRLRHLIMGQQESHYPYKNIGLMVLSSDISIENLKKLFHQEAVQDNVCIYDREGFENKKMDMVPFFYQCEESPSVNLFFCENNDDGWSQAVLEHVDYVYLIVSKGAADSMDTKILEKVRQRPCDVVIWHSKMGPYKDTAAFYAKYAFKRHHHITDTRAAYQRLYRYTTGQAIGLVISGGGFRGFAHYGLIKALFEAKIPVDCIGGSSMGAAIGAGLALDFEWKAFDKLFTDSMKELKSARPWKHFTLPMFSLLSGEVVTRVLKNSFGAYHIEDLSINFFCVASNLSKSQKEIKKIGELWEWLRASVSIPGALPPFEKDGLVYVDGAVCTNLPILDMREYLDDAGKIISFDIHIPPFHHKSYHFPAVWSMKEAIKYQLRLSKSQQYVVPSFFDVIMESSVMNQSMYDMQGAKKADVIVSPDTSMLSFNDPKKSESLSLLAHELAKEKFQEKKALFERWIL